MSVQNLLIKNLRPVFVPSLTNDGPINIKDVQAIIFRNAGTATVSFQGGLYTLDSKETLSLNVTEDFHKMQLQDIMVSFDTSTGGVRKLEMIILKSALDC